MSSTNNKLNINTDISWLFNFCSLTHKAPYTTKAEFANTVDPDETAHNELSHLDLQCLLSSL